LASTSPEALFHQACHYVLEDLIYVILVSNDYIILLELSDVTYTEEHFAAASSMKVTHYGHLLSDLECTGLLDALATIEVGRLGHFFAIKNFQST